MCLYSRLIKNPRFKENKKNGGIIPPVNDPRTLYIPIGCGDCIECRKQKARKWQVRLQEDIKDDYIINEKGEKIPKGKPKFITLTFSNESIKELIEYIKERDGITPSGYELDNEIATTAMRLFNERWRKKFKKAIRHWMITELGHNGTENIHLHGIVWTNENFATIAKIWKYGFIWPRPNEYKTNYVSAKTINYITKYVHKKDEIHKHYKSIVLTSPGIGANYTLTKEFQNNAFNGQDTIETYRTNTGHKIALPTYWRNKRYTEKEREQLWLNKLDEQVRYICGEKIDVSKGHEDYFGVLQHYRQMNARLGYGNGDVNWTRKEYEQQRREMMHGKRITMAKG